MSFNINGASFKGVSTLGSSQPEAGYYEVTGLQIEQKAGDKADARRFHVEFPNGFKMFSRRDPGGSLRRLGRPGSERGAGSRRWSASPASPGGRRRSLRLCP